MNYFWSHYRKDKFFLLNYFFIHALALTGAISLFYIYNIGLVVNFDSYPFFLLPLAFIFGIKVPTLMHNCVHDNLKRFNFIIGELTSFFVLMGFGIISINHTFHHAFSDSDMDPHSPQGKSFLQFFFTALISGADIIEKKFLEFHGNNERNQLYFKAIYFLHYLGIALRIALWYQILGNELFIYFYVPAFISYLFAFAHINYITHGQGKDGEAVILNKDSNLWYKVINLLGDGVYYHKNHHIKPGAYNPKYI
jgi:stearoyl-CoA desaturase (delta-9 desaturase)